MSSPNINLANNTPPATHTNSIDTSVDDYFKSLATRYASTIQHRRLLSGLVLAMALGALLAIAGGLSLFEPSPNEPPIALGTPWRIALVAVGITMIFGVSLAESYFSSRALKGPHLAFCYLFDATEEIRKSITTGFHDRLDRASELLHEFTIMSEISFTVEVEEIHHSPRGVPKRVIVPKKINVGELIFKIKEGHWWFNLDTESQLIAEAYRLIPDRLQRRIHLRVDLDRVCNCLRALLRYQYSLLAPSIPPLSAQNESSASTIDAFRRAQLSTFAAEVAALGDVHTPAEHESDNVFTIIRARAMWLAGVTLMSRNLVASFASWLTALGATFVPTMIVILRHYGFSLDVGGIVAIVGIPFAGAIAMSTAVYSKNK